MFNLVTHGRGGWTYDVVYNLPLHLRNFYTNELIKLVETEQDVVKKASGAQRPAFKPPT